MQNEVTNRILEGSQELFFRYGIKSITMDDIARHLGMSKKTIYQSYSDKSAIVDELLMKSLRADRENFDQIKERSDNVVTELCSCMDCITDIFSRVNPVLFSDLQKYHPVSWKKFTDFKQEYIFENIKDSLERGKKEGLIRKNINSDILATIRVEMIEISMNQMLFPPNKFNLVEVQRTLHEHFMFGVFTLKGHELYNKYHKVKDE